MAILPFLSESSRPRRQWQDRRSSRRAALLLPASEWPTGDTAPEWPTSDTDPESPTRDADPKWRTLNAPRAERQSRFVNA